jgi:hypothetical protein
MVKEKTYNVFPGVLLEFYFIICFQYVERNFASWHMNCYISGRTEEDGLGPFSSRGFIESGIARNVVPVLR